MSVADTILQQLGGAMFQRMTGSHNFIGSTDGLSMKLTRNKSKANYLKITLLPSDTYRMVFERVSLIQKTFTVKHVVKAQYDEVYFDQLQELFTAATGLYTRL